MGCGFADPAALQQMIEDHKKMEKEAPKPEIPIEEKNRKKMLAIEATRQDGKKLFKEGKYREAIKIYERGVLICNGVFDVSDEDWEAVQRHEMLLNLNVATCNLKLKEYLEAIKHCKMALNIDKKCMKAHYRMAQAHLGIGNLDDAQEALDEAQHIEPDSIALKNLGQTIKRSRKLQKEKTKAFAKQMAAKMATSKKKVETAKEQPLSGEKKQIGNNEELSEGMKMVEKLERLAKLHKDSMISKEEYVAAKRQLIGL